MSTQMYGLGSQQPVVPDGMKAENSTVCISELYPEFAGACYATPTERDGHGEKIRA